MRISYKNVEEDAELMLALLAYEYCLPRAFWTDSEWNKYSFQKIGYTYQLGEYRKYRVLCNKYKDEEEIDE